MRYFERCTPEEQGISSMDIIRFLEEAKRNQCHIHTFLLLRHGKVVAEGYQFPYTSQDKRLLNSVSKTFTALGVGIAYDEKRLKLEDKVISYFPEYMSNKLNQKVDNMTIAHLLTMSTGHASDSLFEICNEKDWIRAFLNMEITYKPGEKFQYDSGATFMLSAILSRVTGMPLDEYLKTRLFDPLHIDYIWDRYEGITTGGWGLMLRPEDIAKLGILFLQNGTFEGQRIISEEWLSMGSTKQIDTHEKEYRPDWAQGYGFQMWRSVGNAFRADGAFGQFCLMFPKENLIAVFTAEDGYSQELLTTFYNNVVKKALDIPMAIDTNVYDKLSELVCEMEKPFIYPATTSYLEQGINGKKYIFKDELGGMNQELMFNFAGSSLMLSIAGSQTIRSSKVTDIINETSCIIEPATVLLTKEQRGRCWKYSAHHRWINDTVLLLELCYIETGHSQQIFVEFRGKRLRLLVVNGCKRLLAVNGMEGNQGMMFEDRVLEAETK